MRGNPSVCFAVAVVLMEPQAWCGQTTFFKEETAGPLITSIAIFLLLKYDFDKSFNSLIHLSN